jgi:hypothetical protein
MRILKTSYEIRSIADLQVFCADAISAAAACEGKSVHSSTILLQQPLDMWVVETTLSDGSKVYDVTHTPARETV